MLISGITLEELAHFVATSHKIISNYARHQADLASELEKTLEAPT